VNILIDAGITKKQISDNLMRYGLTIKDIQYLFITHEHTDHILALPTLLKECGMMILMSFGTLLGCKEYFVRTKKPQVAELLQKRFDDGSIIIINRMENSFLYPPFMLDDLRVQVLPAFHDARECIGFSFTNLEKKLVYMTDTGYVHQDLYEEISNAEAYLLESNHDPEILMHSNRPYNLKIRILSDHGHMSNEDSMVTLCNVMGNKTKLILHAHVSQECNLSEIIELTRKKVFDDYGIDTSNVKFVILQPRFSGDYEI
jgi:phosphoribosyl 1,2-cyclic phosphodiesterase